MNLEERPNRYPEQPATTGSSDDVDALWRAFQVAKNGFLTRCQLLEVEPNSEGMTPVFWLLTEKEMHLIYECLNGLGDAVAVVLAEQLDSVFTQIRLMREQNKW